MKDGSADETGVESHTHLVDRTAPAAVAATVGDRRQRRLLVALIVIGVPIAAYVAAPAGVASEVTYLAALGTAAIVAWLGARRNRFETVALLVAVCVSVSAAADVLWQVVAWSRGSAPEISAADFLWVGSYVALGAALLRASEGGQHIDRDGMVDMTVVFLVALLVQWELAFDTIATDTTLPIRERLVYLLYPTLDAALLALLVRARLAGRMQGMSALLIAGGTTCWLLSDFGYSVFAGYGSFEDWMSVGWILGSMQLAMVSWHPRAARDPRVVDGIPEAGHTGAAQRGGLAVAIVPLLAPGAVAVVGHVRHDPANPYLTYAVTVMLVALAFTRGTRILRAEALAQSALQTQERYASAVAVNSADASVLLDATGAILKDAPRLSALLGRAGSTTIGESFLGLLVPTERGDARAVFERCRTSKGQMFEQELRLQHADGYDLWLGARLVDLSDDPDVGGIVVNLHDISERMRAQAELQHQAFHDGLTDLANRALFSNRVEHALRRNARTGLNVGVVFLDLDGFKTVNDSLGHGAGDVLLREVAGRLNQAIRSSDTVARLGGDEFAILIEQSANPIEESEGVAERILQSLASPIELGSQAVTMSASFGIAASDVESTATSLLRDADVAMYRAKAAGKARWVIYDPEMRAAAVERLVLENDLIGALAAGQFMLVYQPVVRLETEEIVGFEALLRWNHPTLGLIEPDRFISIAEETGMIVPIGRWVLNEASATVARWHSAHPQHRNLSMAVNVSARQIASAHLVSHVRDAILASGIEPASLVLEMTETSLIHDTTVAATRLKELNQLGVRLAIDDFGTGYSSLSYLRQFPVDILKIDRSFIGTISDRAQVPAIVRGLLDLGRTLELETIAEGVELGAQRDQLVDEKCGYAQGYLFSRPLEAADAEKLLGRLTTRMAIP